MRRNPAKAREAMRRWRARHPDEHKRARDAYDAAHPESANARRKRYRQAHPEVRRVITQLRRARLAGAGGKYTMREWADLVLLHHGRCAYCGVEGPLQPDHRVPLALGGSNLIENILPACGRCNRRKHLMSEAEFRARLARDGGPGAPPFEP
jgi:5-methylcytosine-specific restriction endonuclease McrA